MSKLKLYIISANLLLVLGFFFFNIMKNETVLSRGEIVLLELRPVDPRSIMQGDYMALRYKLGDDMKRGEEIYFNEEVTDTTVVNNEDITSMNDEDTTMVSGEDTTSMNDEEIADIDEEEDKEEDITVTETEDYSFQDHNAYKYCVVRLDKDRVAHYVRLANSADGLQENEMLLRYAEGKSVWEKYVYFGSDSYFFQEGTGNKYAHAKYGMLKVATEGSLIGTCNLVGLCGDDKQLIK